MNIDANLVKGMEIGFGVGFVCGLIAFAVIGAFALWLKRTGEHKCPIDREPGATPAPPPVDA